MSKDEAAKRTSGSMSRRDFARLAGVGAGAALLAPGMLRAQARGVIKIGSIQPVTGPSAAYGIRARDGGIIAADEINAAGGWKDAAGKVWTFELVQSDMANDPRQAITLFRQLVGDASVVAAVGPTNSVGFVPLVPVASQIKLPVVGSGSGAPIKEWNAYACRVNPVASVAVPVMLRKIVAKEKVKTMAIIFDQTQDAQAGDAEVCRNMAKELGYTVTASEAFRSGDQDFSPQIAKIRSTRPDAIYVAAATGDGVKVASQIREAGIDKPMITGYGSFHDPVYWDGTKGQIKGCYTWLGQDLNSPTPQLKSFLEKYNKRFPQDATSFSAFGYDAVFAIVAAVRRAGVPDRDKVAAALASLDVTTPLGTRITIKNPPDGNNQNPSVVVVQVNGRGTYTTV
jgi:branched-chain amino acid transport system substrate-binding protein